MNGAGLIDDVMAREQQNVLGQGNTHNTKRHRRHADLQVTGRGGRGGLRGSLGQPALDGEDDGRPADHLVACEDLVCRVLAVRHWIDSVLRRKRSDSR